MSNNFGSVKCPKLVLFLIFSSLDSSTTLGRCERVCKRWKETIEQNDQLWGQAGRKEMGENFGRKAKELFKCNWKKVCKIVRPFSHQGRLLVENEQTTNFIKATLVGDTNSGKTCLLRV